MQLTFHQILNEVTNTTTLNSIEIFFRDLTTSYFLSIEKKSSFFINLKKRRKLYTNMNTLK